MNLRVASREIAKIDTRYRKIEDDWKINSTKLSGDELVQAKKKYNADTDEINDEHFEAVVKQQDQMEDEEDAVELAKSVAKLSMSGYKSQKTNKNNDDDDVLSGVIRRQEYQGVESIKCKEQLIAYVSAIKSVDSCITNTSMEVPKLDKFGSKDVHESEHCGHTETGSYVAILSVVVSPEYQGTGIGTTLLVDYIQRLETVVRAKAIVVRVEEKNMTFYERLGFTDEGVSELKSDSTEWHNMVRRSVELDLWH